MPQNVWVRLKADTTPDVWVGLKADATPDVVSGFSRTSACGLVAVRPKI